jgi:hypothetical protein
LPELRERFPIDRSSVPDDESVRFHVADAVRALFQRAARQRSLLLILEDLHWADQGSLLLLEFIAQDIGANSLLVLATYRDGELTAPLVQTLGELARLGAQRIALSGLTSNGRGVCGNGAITNQLAVQQHDMRCRIASRTRSVGEATVNSAGTYNGAELPWARSGSEVAA